MPHDFGDPTVLLKNSRKTPTLDLCPLMPSAPGRSYWCLFFFRWLRASGSSSTGIRLRLTIWKTLVRGYCGPTVATASLSTRSMQATRYGGPTLPGCLCSRPLPQFTKRNSGAFDRCKLYEQLVGRPPRRARAITMSCHETGMHQRSYAGVALLTNAEIDQQAKAPVDILARSF